MNIKKITFTLWSILSSFNFVLASDSKENPDNLIFLNDKQEEITTITSFSIIGKNGYRLEGRNLTESDSKMFLPILKKKYLEEQVYPIFSLNDHDITGKFKNKEPQIETQTNSNNQDLEDKEEKIRIFNERRIRQEKKDFEFMDAILQLPRKNTSGENGHIDDKTVTNLFSYKHFGKESLIYWNKFIKNGYGYDYPEYLIKFMMLESEFGRETVLALAQHKQQRDELWDMKGLENALRLIKKPQFRITN